MSDETRHQTTATIRTVLAASLLIALQSCLLCGCAGGGASGATDEPSHSTTSKKGSRERELDLVVPETGTVQEDLTKLDDATLDRRIAEANRHVNELTGQAFLHAASATDGDLGKDPAYRTLLVETLMAESALDRLEREKARRSGAGHE